MEVFLVQKWNQKHQYGSVENYIEQCFYKIVEDVEGIHRFKDIKANEIKERYNVIPGRTRRSTRKGIKS